MVRSLFFSVVLAFSVGTSAFAVTNATPCTKTSSLNENGDVVVACVCRCPASDKCNPSDCSCSKR